MNCWLHASTNPQFWNTCAGLPQRCHPPFRGKAQKYPSLQAEWGEVWGSTPPLGLTRRMEEAWRSHTSSMPALLRSGIWFVHIRLCDPDTCSSLFSLVIFGSALMQAMCPTPPSEAYATSVAIGSYVEGCIKRLVVSDDRALAFLRGHFGHFSFSKISFHGYANSSRQYSPATK